MKKQIAKNLSSNYFNKIVTMGLTFFIVPFLTRRLGKESFGIIVLAESSIMFFAVLSNSMKLSMTRFAAYAFAQDKKDEFADYLSTGRFLLIACAAAVLLIGSAISWF